MNEMDIAYEEWAENYETAEPKEAFIAGALWANHMAAKQCVKVCDESTGQHIKNGAFRCYNKIKDLVS